MIACLKLRKRMAASILWASTLQSCGTLPNLNRIQEPGANPSCQARQADSYPQYSSQLRQPASQPCAVSQFIAWRLDLQRPTKPPPPGPPTDTHAPEVNCRTLQADGIPVPPPNPQAQASISSPSSRKKASCSFAGVSPLAPSLLQVQASSQASGESEAPWPGLAGRRSGRSASSPCKNGSTDRGAYRAVAGMRWAG